MLAGLLVLPGLSVPVVSISCIYRGMYHEKSYSISTVCDKYTVEDYGYRLDRIEKYAR
jgi:hypothetical protein